MVEFPHGYSTPMDREYGHHGHAHEDHSPAHGSTNDVGVGIGDFGMSMGLGPVPNVHAIQAKIRPGSKKVEFVFTGAGKGSGQGQTPEMYGKKQRQALAEISTANRVDFTTHATVGVYGLAGMDQQGNFSKSSKQMSINEIKRAIEFAADVGQGGPVVVHTGEFQRPIVDAEWNKEDDHWKNKFKMYTDEEERFSYRVVDVRTGGMIQEARQNRKVARQIWNRYEEKNAEYWEKKGGETYSDVNGNLVKPGDYIDYEGNRLDMELRVPRFNREKGEFEAEQLNWNDLSREAEQMTLRAREVWRKWKQGELSEEQFTKTQWARFKTAINEEEIKLRPEEAYIITTLQTNAANSRGWAYYYGSGFKRDLEQMEKLQKALPFYEQLEKDIPEDDLWKIKIKLRESELDSLVPSDAKKPSEWIKDKIQGHRHHMLQAQEASASQWAQAAEAEETIRNVESAESYAFREACQAYAESAMSAWQQSKKLEEMGKLKKPLAIAMENLFPETYGSHPDELIRLVHGSRERMAKLLEQRGMSEHQAQEAAKNHITATFDTGHLNMWRKYWQADPAKSMAENDEHFNHWALEKIEKMMDKGILGHVHVDDNYGYHDDHLAPGEGNTPIKEMILLLKKKGYKGELIVEPGADYTTDVSGFHSVMKTWKLFGSPVYGGGSGLSSTGRGWGQVQYGWFGQNQPPYFVFQPYSPSEDWTLWSGVQME